MSSPKPPDGFNPLRWDCDVRGCFNKKKRPKIELFADCFPGRINFSDVDGIVELNGHGLMVEWKEPGAPIPRGQSIMYTNLTRNAPLTVFVVYGNAETMEVSGVCRYVGGVCSEWHPCDLHRLKGAVWRWAQRAQKEAA